MKTVLINDIETKPGLSTLMTSAPRSPRIIVQYGPAKTLQNYFIQVYFGFVLINHRSILYRVTKLREGNFFSRVCLSVCSSGRGGPMWPLRMMHWTSLCRGPLPPGDLFKLVHWSTPLLVTSGGHNWLPVQNCWLEDPLPNWYWHLVATKPRIDGKRVVRILLECFLCCNFHWF